MTQASWSLPATSRLLFEAGFTFVNNDCHTFRATRANHATLTGDPRAAHRPGLAELRSAPGATTPAINTTSPARCLLRHRLAHVQDGRRCSCAAIAATTREVDGRATSCGSSTACRARVVVFATPLRSTRTSNAQIGIYAQDQWKIDRLTLNLGVRFDYYNASVSRAAPGPGVWVPGRDVTLPRGGERARTGRTGCRGSARPTTCSGTGGRRSRRRSASTSSARRSSPTRVQPIRPARSATSATRTWNDANRDFVPQESELGPISAGLRQRPHRGAALRPRHQQRLGQARQQLGDLGDGRARGDAAAWPPASPTSTGGGTT